MYEEESGHASPNYLQVANALTKKHDSQMGSPTWQETSSGVQSSHHPRRNQKQIEVAWIQKQTCLKITNIFIISTKSFNENT